MMEATGKTNEVWKSLGKSRKVSMAKVVNNSRAFLDFSRLTAERCARENGVDKTSIDVRRADGADAGG
jgi:hypothetical protein